MKNFYKDREMSMFRMKKNPNIDYGMFDNFMGREDLKSLNGLQICKLLYEVTYMSGILRFHEERNQRMKYEKTIIEKVGIIDRQEREISRLLGILSQVRERHPEYNLAEVAAGVSEEFGKIVPKEADSASEGHASGVLSFNSRHPVFEEGRP